MDFGSIASIVFLPAVTLAIGYFMQDIPYRDNLYTERTKQRTAAGKKVRNWFVVLFFCTLIKGCWDFKQQKDDKKDRDNFETRLQNNQKVLESRIATCDTVKTRMEIAMAKIGYEYNETKKELITIKNRKIKFPKQEIEPVLDISDDYGGGQKNPTFTLTGNKINFEVFVNAVGASIGHIISYQFILITQREGVISGWKQFRAASHKSNLVYKDLNYRLTQKLVVSKIIADTFFMAVEVVYSNEKKTIKKHLRRIYAITLNDTGKHIPQLNDDRFDELEKYLRKNKVWE